MDSPEQDVERLQRTLEQAARTSQYWKDEHAAANREIDRLQAEVAALKELLHKYGKHMISCDVVMLPGVDQCTCGYDAALARGGQG